MEGKQKFDYGTVGKSEKNDETDIQDIMAKVLQIIIGLIMAILHM
ncbi:hypothetical protein PYS58_11105 [Chryseobacterium indologenes]|nr:MULTISPECIES: hypothetical protein [Chryseobacterium]WET51669.1 hypothetical protein PYS58_11105 [Chryseobacterium indologenes]